MEFEHLAWVHSSWSIWPVGEPERAVEATRQKNIKLSPGQRYVTMEPVPKHKENPLSTFFPLALWLIQLTPTLTNSSHRDRCPEAKQKKQNLFPVFFFNLIYYKQRKFSFQKNSCLYRRCQIFFFLGKQSVFTIASDVVTVICTHILLWMHQTVGVAQLITNLLFLKNWSTGKKPFFLALQHCLININYNMIL